MNIDHASCRVQPHRRAERTAGVGRRRSQAPRTCCHAGSAAGNGRALYGSGRPPRQCRCDADLECVREAVCWRREHRGPPDSPRRQTDTVVGVLPSWFTYPDTEIQLWVPYKTDASSVRLQHHDWHRSHVVARLRPDVSLASAIAQVGAIQYQLHLQYPHDPVETTTLRVR